MRLAARQGGKNMPDLPFDLELETDLTGRVENLSIQPKKEVYWPIFEAIKNALDAIEESKRLDGEIVVEIERDESQQSLDDKPLPKEMRPVDNISIVDNGQGFDSANLKSFNQLDSRKKKAWGGKGNGRTYWLKTFDEVQIQSHFKEDGHFQEISFKFSLPKGITSVTLQNSSGAKDTKTVVKLIGYKSRFEKHFRTKHLSTLKGDIVRHFMSYLMMHPTTKITLRDGDEVCTIDKEDLPHRVEESFEIQGKKFTINHMKLRTSDPPGHHLYYCAHDRVVGTANDVDANIGVPSKGTKIESAGGESFYYAGYVQSPVLDESVNVERTRFSLIDTEDDLIGLGTVSISWPAIKRRCNEAVYEFLKKEIEVLKKTKEDRINDVLSSDLPGLGYVKNSNAKDLEDIPVDATEEEIAREVAMIHLKNRTESEKEAEALIERLNVNDSSIHNIYLQCVEKLQHLGQVYAGDLAQYVAGRASVLHLFSRLLQIGESGKFEYEKTLHSLVFPMRIGDEKEKHEMSTINHNLWLFDEKFSFYEYLASDLQMKGHKPLAGATSSEQRPDISIYFFSDDYSSAVFDSIVIIEFKRPGRTAVANGGEDPIRQVFSYIDEIRERMPDFKGREIPTRPNTKFYCYIVCDTETKNIRETMVANYSMNETLDPGGYFANFPKRNAYVELISYRKLLADAYKRNQAFFRKLGMPENLLKQGSF